MADMTFQLTTDISMFSLGLLILLGISLILSLRVQRRFDKVSKDLYLLQNEFRAINSGQLGMGRSIRKVSQDIAYVETLQQQKQDSGQIVNEKVYEQAGLLLQRGATIEEVVEACDIAPAEAELIAIISHSAASFQSQNINSKVA